MLGVLDDYVLNNAEVRENPEYLNGKTNRKTGSIEISVKGLAGKVMILDADTKDIRINSFHTGSLQADHTSPIYQAAYTWAVNNGKRVVPDYSYTPEGTFRRISHMLSSMLRHATTRHLFPHAEVRAGFTGGDNPSDVRFTGTVGYLAWKEATMALQQMEDNDITRYEREIYPSDGAALSGAVETASRDDAEDPAEKRVRPRVGVKTYQRASWVALWLRAQRLAGPGESEGSTGHEADQRAEFPSLSAGALMSASFDDALRQRGRKQRR
jgi:hypothetical protein